MIAEAARAMMVPPSACGAGTARARLAPDALAPLGDLVRGLRARPVRQSLLSGLHNPFGRGAAVCDPWRLLDVCESDAVLDAVAEVIGPDIVLWDSELYLDAAAWAAARRHEGRYWPADPLAGAVADIALDAAALLCCDVRLAPGLDGPAPGAHYVIRYMPATSLYNRDPLYAPNRVATEERPLVNYLDRPLWLVRGEDRAGSDFAAGYQTPAPGWAGGEADAAGSRQDGALSLRCLDSDGNREV